MHAFLVISKSNIVAKNYANKIAFDLGLKLLQIELQKISDSKSLTSFSNLNLSKTAIFIENIDTATNEAVNAFLKTLEEPGGKHIFILTAKKEHGVLPTVLSRCQIIRTDPGIETDARQAREFLSKSDYERLNELKNVKSRENADEYLTQLIYNLNKLLLTDTSNYALIAKAISLAEKTKQAISANGNVTLQLANFVFNI